MPELPLTPEEEAFRQANPYVSAQTSERQRLLQAHAWPTKEQAQQAADNHLLAYQGQVLSWDQYLAYKAERFLAWGIPLPTEYSRY